MSTVRCLLDEGAGRLAASTEDPRLEAQILLGFVLGRDRAWLYAWPESVVTTGDTERFHTLIDQRAKGMPIAYLTGTREFWSMPFGVSADTLIPRPETELLVELALQGLSERPSIDVLDLGTGSGIIAASLAKERPDWNITATDRSTAALSIAADNCHRLGVQVTLLQSDWYGKVTGQFDLIASNPPYIADDDHCLATGDLRYEPRSALASGHDGLTDLGTITRNALQFLRPDGWLMVEHGATQGDAVRALFAAAGFDDVSTRKDLAGLDRVTLGRHETKSQEIPA